MNDALLSREVHHPLIIATTIETPTPTSAKAMQTSTLHLASFPPRSS
ncbi:hypothetical protein [Actinomadura sp. KC216]|nr:hypothetical protein [Actinomadura sp. KC216]